MSAIRTPGAMRDTANGSDPGSADRHGGDVATRQRFRPNGRRRNRIAAGVALVAAAIAANVLLYAGLDERTAVVQVTRDVPAGELITADALRTVDADVDGSVDVVTGADLDRVVGQYATVRLVSGSLVTARSLQPDPLVDDGSAVLAITVPDGALPIGLRERSSVQLVLPPADDDAVTRTILGRVVGLPHTPDSAIGTQSLSVEVAALDAPTLAAADDVRVVLVEPSADPAVAAAAEVPATPLDTSGGGS